MNDDDGHRQCSNISPLVSSAKVNVANFRLINGLGEDLLFVRLTRSLGYSGFKQGIID